MIPGETSKSPGKDSMGMDMVPVYEGDESASATSGVRIDPVTAQSIGVRYVKARRGPLVRRVRTVGYVDYDEPRTAYVAPRVAGWIEHIDVDTTGQEVHRGDPLFDVYSPELYSAQAEYLIARRQARDVGGGLLEEARTKLRFLDVPDDQVAEIERTGRPLRTLTIRSPMDGIVTHKTALLGDHFAAGTRLYTISDIATVWVFGEVYERDLAFVRLGQEASMSLSYMPGRTFLGRVTYVYPYVDPKTRTARVRMEFHNPGYLLKPGMYADVSLESVVVPDAVLVPESAVLRSGERATVFVRAEEGHFIPTAVKLGLQGDGDVLQIRSGLAGGEEIVFSGQFLIDSESQLREAIQKMLEPGTGNTVPMEMPMPKVGAGTAPVASSDAAAVASPSASLRYVCPMPEHVGVVYDAPEKCPLCGMTLVPFRGERSTGTSVPGPPLYWTCPMPEHSDRRAARTGTCPLCGMTLIPVYGPPPETPPGPKEPPASKSGH